MLPWIQDTDEAEVWARWGVTYRDVFIVDGGGELVGVYNLTTHDLGLAANARSLEEMIAAAAVMPDADGDRLSDLWEVETFGDLAKAGSEQPDAMIAYAFGRSPVPRAPYLALRLMRSGQGLFAEITFDARMGAAGGLRYGLEISADGEHWVPLEFESSAAAPPRPHYDGKAMARFTLRSASPLRQPAALVRANAGFGPQ